MAETLIDSFDNTVIPDPGTYLIKYKVTDDHGNIVEKTRTVIIEDTTAPTVTLNGSASVFVDEDTTYSDQGVTWSDNDSQATLDTDDGGFDINTPGDYTYTYRVTDRTGNSTSRTRTVTVRDKTPPVITLNGSANVTHEAGTTYIDAGATATDTVDGDVTVSVNNLVNRNITGNYTVTYTATDAAGNTATKTRTVTVKDTIKPVITLNGSANVTHEAGTSYTDAGATATDTFDTNVPVTTSGTVNINNTGSYTIRYNATDDAGNDADEVTRTVTVQDTTAPDAPTVSGDQNFFLYVGDTAPGAPSCSEAGSTLVTSGSVNMNTAGTYEITYRCEDAAGNQSDSVTYSIVVSDPADPDPVPIEDELLDLGDDEQATEDAYSAPLSGEFTQTVPSNLEISEDSLDILCSGDTAVFGGYGYYGASNSHPKEIPGLLVEQIWSPGASAGTDRWFETTYAIPKNDGTGTNIVVTNKATTFWTFNKVHNKDALTYQWTTGLGQNPSGPLSTFEPMSGGGDKFYGMFGAHEFHNSATAGEVGWARKLLKEDGTALASAYPISYTVLTNANISEWETRVQQANISGKYTFKDSNGSLDLRLDRYINDPSNTLIQAGDYITLAWYPLIQSIDVASFCDAEPAADVVPLYTNSSFNNITSSFDVTGALPNTFAEFTVTSTTNSAGTGTTLSSIDVNSIVYWSLVNNSCTRDQIVYRRTDTNALSSITLDPNNSNNSSFTGALQTYSLNGNFYNVIKGSHTNATFQTVGFGGQSTLRHIQNEDGHFITGRTANEVINHNVLCPVSSATNPPFPSSLYETAATLGVDIS